MPFVVLDTDVFSFFFKQDTRAGLYQSAIADAQLCVCFQTVAEIKLWALTRQWGTPRRQQLEEVIRHYIVFPYDALLAEQWARVTATRRSLGHPINCGDAWIAASALRHDATLLTHNGRDYAGIADLKLISHGS
jgi:tRNA(fMet)-specific endonuclease VapC